jgi:hypothetical protein
MAVTSISSVVERPNIFRVSVPPRADPELRRIVKALERLDGTDDLGAALEVGDDLPDPLGRGSNVPLHLHRHADMSPSASGTTPRV